MPRVHIYHEEFFCLQVSFWEPIMTRHRDLTFKHHACMLHRNSSFACIHHTIDAISAFPSTATLGCPVPLLIK